MKTKNVSVLILWIICVFIMLGILAAGPGCREGESPGAGTAADKSRARAAPTTGQSRRAADEGITTGGQRPGRASSRRNEDGEGEEDKREQRQVRRLSGVFLKRFDHARHRKLEYRVTLTYRTENLTRSRRELLEIIDKHRGFLKSASSSVLGSHEYMNTKFFVPVQNLYDALLDLDKIGRLISENITVTDHTGDLFERGLRIELDRQRIARRARSLRTSPATRNYMERERALEESEESLLRTRVERWRLEDKVALARIAVYLRGREMPPRPSVIKVPPYIKALYGLANFFLYLTYVLVWISPLLVILILIIWKRRWILGLFRRKRQGPAE